MINFCFRCDTITSNTTVQAHRGTVGKDGTQKSESVVGSGAVTREERAGPGPVAQRLAGPSHSARQTHKMSAGQSTRFFEQRAEDLAAHSARAWMSVKANKLSLPMMNKGADADGDGLLSKEE